MLIFFLLLDGCFESRESDVLRDPPLAAAATSLSLLRLPPNLLGRRVFMSAYRSTLACPNELDRRILFLLFIGGSEGIFVAATIEELVGLLRKLD